MTWSGWGSSRCVGSPWCSISPTWLFVQIGPAAGGGDDHVTIWSGGRDRFVPTEAVVELLIDVGHVGKDPTSLSLTHVYQRSIQGVSDP